MKLNMEIEHLLQIAELGVSIGRVVEGLTLRLRYGLCGG